MRNMISTNIEWTVCFSIVLNADRTLGRGCFLLRGWLRTLWGLDLDASYSWRLMVLHKVSLRNCVQYVLHIFPQENHHGEPIRSRTILRPRPTSGGALKSSRTIVLVESKPQKIIENIPFWDSGGRG